MGETIFGAKNVRTQRSYGGAGYPASGDRPSIRAFADRITVAVLIALSMLIFMLYIPFLPSDSWSGKASSPFLVALVAAGIGALVYFGRPGTAAAISWLIVTASISWHLFNLGVLTLLDPRLSSLYPALSLGVLGILGTFVVFSLAVARREPLTFATSALALSLTLTPFYYVAIPVMLLPAVIERGAKAAPLILCIIALFIPFLLVENALSAPSGVSTQGVSSVQDLLSSLRAYTMSYTPNIFMYMASTSKLIRDTGPLPALDPASLIVILTDRYVAYFSTYMNLSRLAEIQQGSSQQSLIASLTYNQSTALPLFALSTLQGAIVMSRLAIALIAFGVVVAIAGLVSIYIPGLVRGIPALEEKRSLVDVVSPVITLALGSIVFLGLLIGLAPPLRLTSSLLAQPLNWFNMVLVAGLIGGVFAAREYAIQVAEESSRARQRLAEKLSRLEALIGEASRELASVSSTMPGVDVKDEEGRVEEARAFLKDARSRLEVVGLGVLRSLEERASGYFEEVEKARASLKNKAINQLGTLRALASRGNNQLSQLGLGNPFPEPEDVSAQDSLERILEVYARYSSSLRSSLEAVYGSYLAALESISRIAPQEGLLKPSTSPIALYDLGERVEAVNMVIDLWTRLGEIHWERVREGLAAVAKHLLEISKNAGQGLSERFRALSESVQALASSPVSRALEAERALREAVALASQALERVRADIEYIGDLIKGLAPEVVRVMRFGVLQEVGDVEELSRKIQGFDGSLASAQEILARLSSLASTHRANMLQDEERIVLLVAYPIARGIIEERLTTYGRVSITELPFSLQASALYAKIYAETSKRVQYIEYLGVIEPSGGGAQHGGAG